MSPPRSLHVCLTGGPCGGKTTSLSDLRHALENMGLSVFVVPEVASLLFNGGCGIIPGPDGLFEFQQRLLTLQLEIEAAFRANAASTAAASRRSAVVIYDRGVCDIAAYVPPDMWTRLLNDAGMEQAVACARYDLVVHLQSAAKGAEAVYLSKRPVESFGLSLAAAQALEERTVEAWSTHVKRVVVTNQCSFESKLARAAAAVEHIARQL